MFCSGCGKELPQDAKFCRNCGTAVGGTSPSTARSSKTAVERSEVDKKKPIFFGLFFANVFLALLPFLPTLQFDMIGLGYWKMDEFKDLGLNGSISVTHFLSVMRKVTNITSKNPADEATGLMVFGSIVCYGILIAAAYFLFRAAKKYYDRGIENGTDRAEILSDFTKSSAMAILQIAVIFITKIIFSNTMGKDREPELEFALFFWLCAGIGIICLIGAKNLAAQEGYMRDHNGSSKRESLADEYTVTADGSWICECGSKNAPAEKFCKNCYKKKPSANTDNSWVCNCGTRNPASRAFCKNCDKRNPNAKSPIEKLLNR